MIFSSWSLGFYLFTCGGRCTNIFFLRTQIIETCHIESVERCGFLEARSRPIRCRSEAGTELREGDAPISSPCLALLFEGSRCGEPLAALYRQTGQSPAQCRLFRRTAPGLQAGTCQSLFRTAALPPTTSVRAGCVQGLCRSTRGNPNPKHQRRPYQFYFH